MPIPGILRLVAAEKLNGEKLLDINNLAVLLHFDFNWVAAAVAAT